MASCGEITTLNMAITATSSPNVSTRSGTPTASGTQGRGAVFRLKKDGTGQTELHSFLGPAGDGANPRAGLVQGKDGALYGTTYSGGANSSYGTVFKLNVDGSSYAVLKSFSSGPGAGAYPMAGLVQATNGVFYGTTYYGGASNRGTIFRLNSDGSGFSYLYNFTGTAAEVTPIREYDNRTIGEGKRGPITTKLQALFFDVVNGRNPEKKAWLTKI